MTDELSPGGNVTGMGPLHWAWTLAAPHISVRTNIPVTVCSVRFVRVTRMMFICFFSLWLCSCLIAC
jgi:hypothetical protein